MLGCLILLLVDGRARGGQVDFVLRGESLGSNCFGKFVVSCPAPAIAKFQTNCSWLDSDNFINDRCAAQTSHVFALSQIGCNDFNDNSVDMFEV